MKTVSLFELTGSFAENKDLARRIRLEKIMPALDRNEPIIIDFENITGATQSFIHALISDVIRKHENNIFDLVSYKNCNPTIQKIITIVYEYMNESLD